jgi:HK97 family phage prohead protease
MSGGVWDASAVSVRFAGYAAVFERLDQGGDIIAPGAFAASIARCGGSGVPLLWQHREDEVIGHIESVSEDERGLRVVGEIHPRSRIARQAGEMLREGRIDGLSFGYRVVSAEGQRPRRLEALDLVEVSIVTHPMQMLARVHAVEG